MELGQREKGNDSGSLRQKHIYSYKFDELSQTITEIDTIDIRRDLVCIKKKIKSFDKQIKVYRMIFLVSHSIKNYDYIMNKNSCVLIRMHWKLDYKVHLNYLINIYKPSLLIVVGDQNGNIIEKILGMNKNFDLEVRFAVKRTYRCQDIDRQLERTHLYHTGDRNLVVSDVVSKLAPDEKLEMKMMNFNFNKLEQNIFCSTYLPTPRKFIWSYLVLEFVTFIMELLFNII
ncbi:unnamed protein product [Gordionus sp. m RMFG-2023]